MDGPQEIGLRLQEAMKFAVTLEYFSIDTAVSHLVVDLLVTMIKTLVSLLTYLRFWTDLTEKFVVSNGLHTQDTILSVFCLFFWRI